MPVSASPRALRRDRWRLGRTGAALVVTVLLAGQGAAAAATRPRITVPDSPEGTNTTPRGVVGPLITGIDAINRARTWVDARPVVPYYQTHKFASPSSYYGDGAGSDPSTGWREDCSGFVSYAWGLPGPGYTTAMMPDITTPISWSALRPGDALLIPGHHVALFAKWDDTQHTTYTLWEEANTQDDTKVESGITLSNSYWSQFAPVRYDQMRGATSTPGVVRADNGLAHWFLRDSNSSGTANTDFLYGYPSDIKITGDWDGNGTTTVGVVRRENSLWHWYLRNSNTSGVADISFTYGEFSTDTPVTGDWDGNGTVTPGVVRADGSLAHWYLRNFNTSGIANASFTYGNASDTPVTGDWNGNGTTTIGVVRSDGGAAHWYLRDSNTAGGTTFNFTYGYATDEPVTGDWDGTGVTTIGVVRPVNGLAHWYVRSTNTAGVATSDFTYGYPNDSHVTGDWNAS